jgi:hypothetical protein
MSCSVASFGVQGAGPSSLEEVRADLVDVARVLGEARRSGCRACEGPYAVAQRLVQAAGDALGGGPSEAACGAAARFVLAAADVVGDVVCAASSDGGVVRHAGTYLTVAK